MARTLDPELAALLEQVGYPESRVRGLVPTKRSLYQRLYVGSANTLTAGQDYNLFHVGVGDSREKLNAGNGSGNIDRTDTNLLQDGRISDEELFLCTGLGVAFPRGAEPADVEAFADVEVRWRSRGGKRGLVLGRIQEMPQLYRVAYNFGYGDGVSQTEKRDYPRFAGPPYIGNIVLFAIDGAVEASKKEQLTINAPSAVTPSVTAFNPVFNLYGVWFQRPQDG